MQAPVCSAIYILPVKYWLHQHLNMTALHAWMEANLNTLVTVITLYIINHSYLLSKLFASFQTSAEDGALSTELSGSCSNCIWLIYQEFCDQLNATLIIFVNNNNNNNNNNNKVLLDNTAISCLFWLLDCSSFQTFMMLPRRQAYKQMSSI